MELRGELEISPALQDAQFSEGDTPSSSDNPARTKTQDHGAQRETRGITERSLVARKGFLKKVELHWHLEAESRTRSGPVVLGRSGRICPVQRA